MPAEATKRVIFLDSSPFCFWEHNIYKITGNASDREVCLERNGLDEICPICELDGQKSEREQFRRGAKRNWWPSYVGYFTVVDLGDVVMEGGTCRLEGWQSPKSGKVYQFQRKLFGAKRGGKDKPGTLPKLHRIVQKKGGSLRGMVFDIYRSGGKVEAVGDEFELVERVDDDKILDYIRELAGPGFMDVAPDGFEFSDKPFDYLEVFKPKERKELEALVASYRRGGKSVEGAAY